MSLLADHVAADRHMPNRAAWFALATVAIVVALHATDLLGLIAQWRTSYTYSHGFLVAALIPWLIWREHAGLGFERQVPTLLAAVVLAGLGFLWLLARGAHVDLACAVLLPIIAWTALWGVLGLRSAGRLAFPLAWFWCAMPVWDVLGGALQRLTALVDRVLLYALGIPALLEGSTITVPAGTFEIAAACSGLNFFVVAVTIAALVGQFRRWGAGRRIAHITIAALIAMASNWVRVCLIIAIGQWTEMRTALVREGHYAFGWWLFAAVLTLFLYLTHRWDRAAPAAAAGFAGPVASGTAIARRATVILVVLAAGPVWAGWQDARARSAPVPVVELPAPRQDWSGPQAAPPAAWRPEFAGATVRRVGAYRRGEGTVVADLTYYAVQRPGAKLLGYPSNPDGPPGSTVLGLRDRKLDSAPGQVVTVREMIVEVRSGQRWRVWQWFQAGAFVTARPAVLRLHAGLASLVGRPGSAAVSIAVACAVECRDDREGRVLEAFAADMQESLVRSAAGDGSGG